MNEQTLAPIYEQLGDAFAHAKDKVSIVKIDADGKGKDVGQKYGVTGFPSKHRDVPSTTFSNTACVALKWFNGDDSEPEAYNGARELDDLAAL
jgi:protein disulfide-isomerase A6